MDLETQTAFWLFSFFPQIPGAFRRLFLWHFYLHTVAGMSERKRAREWHDKLNVRFRCHIITSFQEAPATLQLTSTEKSYGHEQLLQTLMYSEIMNFPNKDTVYSLVSWVLDIGVSPQEIINCFCSYLWKEVTSQSIHLNQNTFQTLTQLVYFGKAKLCICVWTWINPFSM